jgi:hypothetical protein
MKKTGRLPQEGTLRKYEISQEEVDACIWLILKYT